MDTGHRTSKPGSGSAPAAERKRRVTQPARDEAPRAADDERTASVPLEPAQRHPRHSDDTESGDEAAPRAWDDRAG